MSENKKEKIDSLIFGFSKPSLNTKITKIELTKYLDTYSSSGKFEQTLSDKLFQVLNLDETSSISIENFVSGFIQFEEDIKSNLTKLKQKLEEKKEEYEKLISTIKLSEETCANSKVYGQITDIDIKRKLKGIKEIILKVIFNDKSEEFHFTLGEDENIEQNEPKIFEFKPTSRNDHFEFIMEGLNNKNKIFDIGSKVFSLTEVKNSEEYLVQIIIPEIDDEKKVAAYINAKIILTWNDKNYEKKKERLEKKIKKVKIALYKAVDYLRKLRDVYEKLEIKKMEKNDLDVYFNNTKKEIKRSTFTVEFNNEKEIVQIKDTQKKEKEEIIDDDIKDDTNKKEDLIENEVKEKDIKDEDIKDSEIKETEEINKEILEEKKETEEEVQKEAIKEEINDKEIKNDDIKEEEVNDIKEEIKKEEELIKTNDIKEEKDNIEEIKENEIKKEEKYIYNQEIHKEIIDYESLIPQIEKSNEINTNQTEQNKKIINSNIQYDKNKTEQYKEIINPNIKYYTNKTELYNEITNPNIQYDTNIHTNTTTQILNQKEEYQEINIDAHLKNNNNTNNINTNYQEYQTSNYKNTNIISNQNLSQSINKEIKTQTTLPVIVKRNVHKVIYDSYVKTLPVIFGGTKVTYVKNKESIDFKNNDIIQNNIPLTKTQIVTPTQTYYNQVSQVQTISQQNPIEIYNQIQTTNTNSQIDYELKNNLSQSYTPQEYPVQTYKQTQSYISENPVQTLNQVSNNIPLSSEQTYSQTQSYIEENPIHTLNQVSNNTPLSTGQTSSQTQTYIQENLVQTLNQVNNNIPLSTEQTYNQTQSYIQENPAEIQNEINLNNEPTYTQTQIYTQENNAQNYNSLPSNIQINPVHSQDNHQIQNLGFIQNDIKVNNTNKIYSEIQSYTQENPIQMNSYEQTYTQTNPIQTYNQIKEYNQIQTNIEKMEQSYNQPTLGQSYNQINNNEINSQNEEEPETDYRLLSIVRNYNPLLHNNIEEGVDYGSLQPTFNQSYNVNEYEKTTY